MRNKRGFTLVEMLAVVVILAILLGIAVPAYNAYINDSRKNAYKTAEQSLVKSGTTAVLDCVNDRGSDFCKDKRMPQDEYEYTIFTLEDLIENGYMDDVKDPKDDSKFCDAKQSYVYIRKNSEEASGGYTYDSCLICDGYKSETCQDGVLDQEDYSFETICKIAYDPAGASLWNGKWTDQDLYLVVSVAGDYRFGISRFDYKKNSGSYQKFALETESAYMKITADTSGDTYRIKAQDGQKRTSETVCHGALSTDTNIKIDKTIINGVTVTAKTSSGTSVTSDTWAKADDGKLILTANPNPSTIRSGYTYQWYKNGEAISGATSKTYTATSRGTYKVIITNGVGVQFKEDSFIVKIDKDKPECKLAVTPTSGSLENGWYTGDVAISFEEVTDLESSDGLTGSGIASQVIDKPTITSNTASTTITGTVTDNVGRTNTCKVTIKRDAEQPEVQSITAKKASAGTTVASGSWSDENLNVTIVAKTLTSGQTIYYCTDTANTCEPTTKYTGAVSITTAGTSYLRYKVTSGVGVSSAVASYTAKIDKTKPTCELAVSGTAVNGWYTGTATISFKTTGDTESNGQAGSGIASQTLSHTSITSNTTASGMTVTGTVTDNVGRTNTCEVTVKRDGSTPTITAKSSPIGLGTGDYTFTSNVTVSYGPASGTTTCDPASTKKTGSYTVTCTATGNNGKTASVSFTARHSYAATKNSKTCTGKRNCTTRECCTATEPCEPWVCDACWGGQTCSVNCGYQISSTCCSASTTCTDCEYYTYDCSTYSCPNGGTLSGTTCNY